MKKIFELKQWLTYISILIFVWCYTLVYSVADWDMWARLAVGKSFFETGHIIKHDYLSYTPTKPLWVDHEWGSGVIFYFFAKHFGDIGLLLLEVFLIFSTIFIIVKIVELQNKKPYSHLNPVFYFFVYLGMFTNLGHGLRCQMFTFLFFSLWIYLLERIRRGEDRLLWTLPASMLLWANIHGGFVAGLGLLFLYGVGEFFNKKPFKKYFLIAIPSVLITLINPYGFHYWDYIFQAVSMPRANIAEWRNSFVGWGWRSFFWYKIFLGIVLSSAAYELFEKKFKNLDITKYLLFSVMLYLSINHIKHQSLFCVVGAAFFYHNFRSIFVMLVSKLKPKVKNFVEKAISLKDGLVYFFIIVLGLFFIFNKPAVVTVPLSQFPCDSIEFVKANQIKGNLFTLFHWGSYAAWKLYPQNLIAIDGRYEEVYTNELFDLTLDVMKNKKNWYDFFNKYHTDIVIIPQSLYKIHNAMTVDRKHWEQVYFGKTSTVFVRKEMAKDKYIYPDKISQDYYNKTKYETNITFVEKK